MPTILIKKSDTPSAVPTGSDLTNLAGGAEIAVNTADKRVFSMNSSSAIIELGTNPQSITVSSGSTLNGGVVINELGADADTRIEGDTDANLFFVDASTDRIGVGTNSPAEKLQVTGNILQTWAASHNRFIGTQFSTTYENGLRFLEATRETQVIAKAADTGGLVTFFTGITPTERLRIDASGNLGLGVTPSAWDSGIKALQVNARAALAAGSSSTVLANNWYDDGNNKYIASAAASLYVQNNGAHSWSTAPSGIAGNTISFGDAKMTLDASGNLLVNCTTGNGKLTVRGPGTTTGYSFEAANSGGATRFLVSDNGLIQFYKSDNAESARITAGGDLLVGGTNGIGRLSVTEAANLSEADPHIQIEGSGYSAFHWLDGTAYYIGQNSAARSLRIYSDAETAGVNLAAGGTSWGTFSDERLKYDIESISNGIDKLINIRCVSYRLKDVDKEDSQKRIGVIAQDLQGTIDEVIDFTKRSDSDDEAYMSVRYAELTPVLIKAIQELSAKNDALEARLAALEAK